MEVSFDMTREDLERFGAYIARFDARAVVARRALRRLVLTVVIGTIPIIVLAGMAIALWMDPGAVTVDDVVLGMVFPVLWAVAVGAGSADRFRRTCAAAATPFDSFALGPRRVRLAAEGVWVAAPYGDAVHRWCSVSLIDSTDDLVALHARDPTTVVIPRRAFADADEAKRFVETARTLRAADPDAVSLLAAFLAGRDLPCPVCRFNLRDHREGRCPECGALLDLGHLRALASGPTDRP